MSLLSTRNGVTFAQRFLKKSGFQALVVDGDYGSNTRTAIMQFQSRNKLATSGDFDMATTAFILATKVDFTNGFTFNNFQSVIGLPNDTAKAWYDRVVAECSKSGIDTIGRLSAFLATCTVESGHFTKLIENMNYSAKALANTWPNRFAINGRAVNGPNALARQIEGKPELIANNVYSNRMGNGPVASGDGWRYRGGGLIALTGRDNYEMSGKDIGMDLLKNPELLQTPEGAVKSAIWYWTRNKLNVAADVGDFDSVSDLVNIGRRTKIIGDAVGYKERYDYWLRYLLAMLG